MYQIILISCANKKEAKRIAIHLVEERLAACVNILDKVESFFWWQGKLDYAKECFLMVKSKKENFSRIIKEIKKLHSYQVPEIIALRITQIEKRYQRWLDESIPT
ncbi:MAG: divalent-cation tolerance protein CutA [Candidatus Omnitrophica bacterium]|nr:divalent-cation tolerance protein CutA [Candidatus Omnitrophota bacterium]